VFVTPSLHTSEEGSRAVLEGRAHLSEVRQSYYRRMVEAPNVRVIRRRELSLGFVGINCAIPPLDDSRVREALACAIDRQALVKQDTLGAEIARGVLPPGMQSFSPSFKALPYDPARSARVLAEAGYPGGKGLPTLDYWTNVRSTVRRRADSLMVADLARVGIRVRVHEAPWTELSQRIDAKQAPLFSLSWVADIPDPDSFLGSLFESASTSNYFGYSSPPVDSLLHQARTTSDPMERDRLFREVESRVLRDVALVPLSHSASLYAVDARVHGVNLTPLGISAIDFGKVWLEAPPDAL
jgi:ABC-type transport system substrate-binding protein